MICYKTVVQAEDLSEERTLWNTDLSTNNHCNMKSCATWTFQAHLLYEIWKVENAIYFFIKTQNSFLTVVVHKLRYVSVSVRAERNYV